MPESAQVDSGESQGEKVLYFPMKVAVARMGGITQAAEKLGAKKDAVNTWLTPSRRARPNADMLRRLAELSGVSLDSLELYYRRLDAYKDREAFRRKPN